MVSIFQIVDSFSVIVLFFASIYGYIVKWRQEKEKKRKDKIRWEFEPDWDWLLELEIEPIEVTFDNRTFLVYDTETEHWNLEIREPEIESEHSKIEPDTMLVYDQNHDDIEKLMDEVRQNEMYEVYEMDEFEIRKIPIIGIGPSSFKSVHKRTEIRIRYEDDYEV